MQTAQTQFHRTGWTERESDLLAQAARDARTEGMPLRQMFERVAFETGRKPNSIRNYYYALLRNDGSIERKRERFVPFSAHETNELIKRILVARANGQSVRACVHELADGDEQLMLRYQNKYRAVLKNRPDVIEQCMCELNGAGIRCRNPYQSRSEAISQAMAQLRGKSEGDPRIMAMLDTLSSLLVNSHTQSERQQLTMLNASFDALVGCARDILSCVRDFLALPPSSEALPGFCTELLELSNDLESALNLHD